MIYVRNWAWGLIWACLYELWEQLIEVPCTYILQVHFLTAAQQSQVASSIKLSFKHPKYSLFSPTFDDPCSSGTQTLAYISLTL